MTDYGHDIEKYLKGELTPAERHALEKKALNDPFLADALEGGEQMKAGDFIKDVAQLNERIAGKKTVSVWMWTARIAAGLALILVSTFIVWTILETAPPQDLAMEKNKSAAPPPTTSDSVTSAADALSSPPVEKPAAGPAVRDKDVAKQQPAAPIKTETKPESASGAAQSKTEPVTESIAVTKAEEKAKEFKVTEPLAQKEAESYRAKAIEDDKVQRSAESKKKAAVSDKYAAPSAAGRADVASTTLTNVIQGQVTSAEDGSPLPGVNVVIKNSTIGTTTDAEGNYLVKVDDTNQTLVYSFIGLKTTEVKVNDRQEVNVSLSLDATQLSEVVTVGYGVQSAGESSPPTVDMTHPESGNRSFKQYLERNIRYPEQARLNKVEGRVTVQFTVETDGSLTNFIVLRGIGSGCDEELIRLIKEGPKWIPTKKDNVPVQDKAKVRLKFQLP